MEDGWIEHAAMETVTKFYGYLMSFTLVRAQCAYSFQSCLVNKHIMEI